MLKPEITHLYKYRPLNEFTLEIITNGMIYFPKPDVFNDPYDCDIRIDHKVSNDDYMKIIEYEGLSKGILRKDIEKELKRQRIINEVPSSFLEKLEYGCTEYYKSNKNMGVLSLCEDYRNILMWAHYADDHNGICIEFERSEGNHLGNDEMTKPVRYLKSYPRIKATDFITSKNASLTQKMLWTKSLDWEYEKEWRMLIEKGNTAVSIPGKITSIIFGIRASQRSIDIVRKLIEGTEIKLRQAEKLANEFGIKANNVI